jgi:hypothetical protein
MSIESCTRAAVAALTLLALLSGASPVAASEAPPVSFASVRADTAGMKQLIADGAARSAAFRTLIAAINQSDLVVYVQCRLFPESELRGRLGLVSAAGGRRYAVIEIACYHTGGSPMAILAHELQHAVEIASAPWVVDARTFEAFYAATGELVRSDQWQKAFETSAAVEQARRVHLELLETNKLRASARAAAAGTVGFK